jgi:hypothetical protein
VSWQAVKAVLDHSDATGPARMALIILAESANADGTNAYPSIDTIAHRMRRSERAAQYALRRLEADGEIAATGKSRRGTVVYMILCARGVQVSAPPKSSARAPDANLHPGDASSCTTPGAGSSTRGVQAAAPEPPFTPPSEPPKKREVVFLFPEEERAAETLATARATLRETKNPKRLALLERNVDVEALEDDLACELEVGMWRRRVAA